MKAIINAIALAGANISNDQYEKFVVQVGYTSDLSIGMPTTFSRYYTKKKNTAGAGESKYGALIVIPTGNLSGSLSQNNLGISYQFTALFWAAENTSQTAQDSRDNIDVERLVDLERRTLQILGDAKKILEFSAKGDIFGALTSFDYFRKDKDTQRRYVIQVNFTGYEPKTYDCNLLPISTTTIGTQALVPPFDNSAPTIGSTIKTAMLSDRDLTQLTDKEV